METFRNDTINTKNIFNCNFCKYKCSNKHDYERHKNTLKHIKNTSNNGQITSKKTHDHNKNVNNTNVIIETHDNGNIMKIGDIDVLNYIHKFTCIDCNFRCSKLGDWTRHINTKKHKTIIEQNKKELFICNNCEKEYQSRNGLWKHKQKCGIINENADNITPEMILELIKNNSDLINENSDFKHIIMEQNNTINNLVKNCITTNNITHNNINSHNKTFNLQVFLNETCKDAMNINDFVDSIKLQLSDFERMGEVGYAQGISDIITSNLQALDITQRPVHCTDKKRETMYVKDQDQWTKEDENKSKIKKMIKRIENKNIQIIPQFQKKYPNYANPKSHESDKYHKTIIEVMGGPGGSEGKEGKIIRNISKVTTIREKE